MGVSPSDPTPPTALTISNAVTIPTGATVNVSNNATLTLNGSAESMIEGGTLNIMSAGRLTATSGNLNVGSQGQQGGMLMASGTTTVDLQSITIGDGSAVATVTSSAGEVTGGFTVHDFAFVGATGFGQLILQGGVFMVQGDLEVGSGGTGTIMASGQSTVRASSVAIGVSGKGTIQLSGGSQLSAPSIFLGEEPGSIGTLSIDGHTADDTEDPTLVVATSGVRVGQAGFGTLILTRGAVLMTPQISIAAEPGSEGTVSIDSASQISSLQAIFVGGSASGAGGTGTLDVSAGADLKVASEVFIYGGSTIKLGGGSIAISSAIQTPGTITIGTGGLLSGAGTIDTRSLSSARQLGVVMTTGFGIVHVGDDPGTLTIIGNYIQSPTGVLEVELGPNNNISTLAVTGTATLGGTLRIVPFNGGMLQLGHTYPVLTAAGGVIGNFATIDTGTSLVTLTGAFNNGVLNLMAQHSPNSFAALAATHNQNSVAVALDAIAMGAPSGNAATLSNALIYSNGNYADPSVAKTAFDQLSGEIHASLKSTLIDDSRFVRGVALDRLRAASGAVGAAPLPIFTFAAASSGTEGLTQAAANFAGPAIWGQAYGSCGRSIGDHNAAGLSRSTGGFLFGADAPVLDDWRLGAIGGYSRTRFNVASRASSGASGNFDFGIYGGRQWGALALRLGASGTWHDISTNRSVKFNGFSDTPWKHYDAQTAQAFGEIGYRIDAGALTLEPYAGLAFVHLHVSGFTENGGAAALTTGASDSNVGFSTLGLRTSAAFLLNGVAGNLRAGIGWRYGLGDVKPVANFSIAGSNAFQVAGLPIARNAALVEAGVDANIAANATLGVSYNGLFGARTLDQSVKGNLTWRF